MSINLLKALEFTRENFEADALDQNESRVDQVCDGGMLGPFVEEGRFQRATAYLPISTVDNALQWVFLHANGKQVPLGQEGLLTETELRMLDGLTGTRVNNNT
jgi:hypothetical protein